jgi:hypothetical protein
MAAPWEKYQKPAQDGPWARYAQPQGGEQAQAPGAPVAPPNPSLFRADSDFRQRSGVGVGGMLMGAAKDMFGSREGAGEYLAGKAGGQLVKGPDGPLVQLPDGTQYRLNDPGIDSADVANVGGNIAAFATPAGWVNRVNQARNAGTAMRVGTQAAAMAGTDAALQATFDEGRINPVRTTLAGVGGGLGEVIGPVLMRGVDKARHVFRSTGDKRRAAQEVAREVGLEAPTPDQIRQLTGALDQIEAGADPATIFGSQRFGFLYSQGQRTLDPKRARDLLSQEEILRQQPASNAAFIQAEEVNRKALTGAVDDISSRLGARPGATPAELSQSVQGRVAGQADELRGRINQAYDTAGQSERAAVSVDAIRTFPDRLKAAVADFDVSPELTPATARTLVQTQNAVRLIPEGAKGVTLRALEMQRRIINNNISAASNPADKRAMTLLKREYDTLVDDAVESALISGDETALKAIKDARGLRAEFGRRFEGREQADKFVADLVDGGRTPEELINVALGAGQVSKSAGGRFVTRLREAVSDDPEVLGSLRAAQFLRMVQDSTGKPMGPQAITNNIARMEYQNPSMIKALYTDAQWAEVKQLARALEPMVPKGDLARTSGTWERAVRYMSATGVRIPFIGEMARGIGGVRNSIKAEATFRAPLKPPARPTPAAPAAMGAALSESVR